MSREELPDKEIIRRLKDRNVYLEDRFQSILVEYKEIMSYQNKLFDFMNRNDLWRLFHKQNDT